MAGFDAEQLNYLEAKFGELHGKNNRTDLQVERLRASDHAQDRAIKAIGDEHRESVRSMMQEISGVGQALREHVAQNGSAHHANEAIKAALEVHLRKNHSFGAFSDGVKKVAALVGAIAVIGAAVMAIAKAFG